jgi:hypothetical protein
MFGIFLCQAARYPPRRACRPVAAVKSELNLIDCRQIALQLPKAAEQIPQHAVETLDIVVRRCLAELFARFIRCKSRRLGLRRFA